MKKLPFFIIIFAALGISGIIDYYVGLPIVGTAALLVSIFMIERYYRKNKDS
jgi:hypothetical protein